jgi:uncharacterized protein (TIGR02266 family)
LLFSPKKEEGGIMESSNDITSRLVEFIQQLSNEQQEELLEELTQKDFKEQRAHPRKPYFTNVDYATKDRFHNDFIQNISAGGVFIETRESFVVGTEISLVFALPNDRIPVKIGGTIVRTTPEGIGIKFTE